ncbi:MAG TPA: hypothetical protein VGD90_04170 [Sphingobacteriaceae bacterium]
MLLVTLSVLLSCQRKVRFTPPPDEVKKDTGALSKELMDPEKEKYKKSFKGLYTYGEETSTFYDCNTRTVYWLTDSTGRLVNLYQTSNRAVPYPHESVYVELEGYLKGKSSLGYASEYDNEIIVKEVIKLKPKDYQTECYPYEFVALGNEPFWSVEIIPHEKRIVFKDIGSQKAFEFPYSASVLHQGSTRYNAVSVNKKNRIEIGIRQQVCSDGMSDKRYNYAATVILNGKTYKGCAIKKGERL